MSLVNFGKRKAAKILGLVGLVFVPSGSIFADDAGIFSECCGVSTIQIGANYTRADFTVDGQPTFHGNLGGIQGIYEYKPWNSFYGGVKVSWKQGGTGNLIASRQLTFVDVQERMGYTFASCCDFCDDTWLFTVFSGLGYRYLKHRLEQFEEPTIKFEYNEFYIPLGFLSECSINSCWSFGFNFTWMPQIYPTVEIIPLKGARWVIENSLGNFLLELPLTYFLRDDKRSALIIKPFYERWKDGQSTARAFNGQKLGLPENTYNFWGIEFNFSVLF